MLIGVEIGGTKLQVALGNGPTDLVHRWRAKVNPEAGGEGIRKQLDALLREALRLADGEVTAIGVGFGGPLDLKEGKVRVSNQVEGWSGFPLRGWLEDLTSLPVVLENDANTAALAEALHGAGKGFDPVFYVTLGSGVGGGLICGGEIYHGRDPGAAEIGLLWLPPHGERVEAHCSGWAMDRRIRDHLSARPNSPLGQRIAQNQEEPPAVAWGEALSAGDPDAESLLGAWAGDFGMALSHVAHLFSPQVIVLGGGLSLVGERLRRAAEASLRDKIHPAFAPGPKLLLSQCGEDVVLVGALTLAMI